MNGRTKIKKILFTVYLVALHCALVFFVYEKINSSRDSQSSGKNNEELTSVVPLPSPLSIPFEENGALPSPMSSVAPTPLTKTENSTEIGSPNTQIPAYSIGKLMIPVIGIKSESLQDTYTQSRSGGRVHNAIDIMAPGGAPVVAAADGEIVKFFDSKLGGITIYQLSADKKYFYYYAHLQRRAENLQEKSFVRQGTVIGYVGDTGNSGAGNFHLHFTITVAKDPNRFWEGEDINPYPILKEGIEAGIN